MKYLFKYEPLYTIVEPCLSQEIIDNVLHCKSFWFSYFDEKRRMRTTYPVKHEENWVFYDLGENSFPSGFLGRVVKALEENGDEYEIEYLVDKPEGQYNFSTEFDSYLNKKEYELRYYQIEPIKEVKQYGNGLLEIGTGGGKTLLYGNLIVSLGVKTLCITIDLTSKQQTYNEFVEMFGEENVGMIDRDNYDQYPIVVANIQNCWAKFKTDNSQFMLYKDTVGLLIVNEAHHINESKLRNSAANTWYSIAMNIPAWYRVGATGTVGDEDSLQGYLLRGAIGEVIYSRNTKQLIAEGYATKIEVHAYEFVSNNNEHSQAVIAYKNLLADPAFNEMIANLALKYANEGYKVAIFCEWLRDQMDIIKQWLGDNCVAVSGRTKEEERTRLFKQFAEGNPSILIGTVFNEDVNIPSMDVGIILGKLKNERKVKQRTGRVARLFEGKSKGIVVIPMIKDVKEISRNNKIKYVDGILAKHSKEAIKILESEGHEIMYKNYEEIDREIQLDS